MTYRGRPRGVEPRGAADVPELDYLDTSRRPPRHHLPPAVREAVAAVTGSAVVHADPPPGSGFSGAFAAALTLDDVRRVFAKAGSGLNPHVLAALGRETTVLAGLPERVPAPRLVGAAALEADGESWQVVVLEHVAGRVPLPWTERSLKAVHEACTGWRASSAPRPPS